jgi:DNA-binding transcriptional ArsR family regulator
MSEDAKHIQRDMETAQKKADILKALAHPVRVRVF